MTTPQFGSVYDYHSIDRQRGNEQLSDTVSRHLITKHNRTLTSSPTLNEMSDLHAKLHQSIGNDHPENDSETTQRQKRELNARLTKLGVVLPDWVATFSFLSDLKTLERIIISAQLARPGVPFPGHQAGIDKDQQG